GVTARVACCGYLKRRREFCLPPACTARRESKFSHSAYTIRYGDALPALIRGDVSPTNQRDLFGRRASLSFEGRALAKISASSAIGHADERQRGTRLRPEERERAILSGAETFFAEHGFDATTRELADYLGVRQSLLYRYFPTKQDLIDRIYNDIFVGGWDPEWSNLIRDRSIPLVERLRRFYALYIPTTLTRQWLRLFYQAGLKGFDISTRYHDLLSREIFIPLCYELRATYCVDLGESKSPTSVELEIIYDLHGAAVYKGVRQHIYGMKIHPDNGLFNLWIESFINNVVPAAYRQLAAGRLSSREGKTQAK
ncbi:conserved hypothetical protein, partial [Ricinus communis]